MLLAFAFQAKPGKEAQFEALLNDAEAGRAVAKAMGATRNTLFLGGGRMVRVFEFPAGVRPRPLADIARVDAKVADFLRKLGPLIQDGFDYDRPETLEAFNRRVGLPLAYDVRP
ncbi:MAG: hypothetical protein QOI63_1565 [Thermoplasmata archaeon]|jgi:hypothetical protein|nr:hypothetical protein [Thermoplasmata archaeon]